MSDEKPVGPWSPQWSPNPWVSWALIGLLVLFATSRAFILDDAFISLRYAENFAQGLGLVFNPGEWTEGYTNFSWTMLLSLPFLLGIDPLVFVYGLSLLFFGVSLRLMYRIATVALDDARLSLVCVAALGLGQTFSAYATSGLETQLHACLTLWIVSLALKETLDSRQCLYFSIACALAMLTRPDAALIVAFWGLWVLWRHRTDENFRAKVVRLFGPGLLIVGAWLAFKLAAYGQLLPNTYYAKVGGSQDLVWGLDYITAFSLATGLLPLAFISPLWRVGGVWDAPVRSLWGFGLFWSLYVVSVGGDFMEYRFMVCVIPVFVLVIVESLKTRPIPAFLVAVGLVAWSYGAPLEWTHRAGVEDVKTLASHLTQPVQDWEGLGKQLGSDLPDGSDVLIATTAAGAIPFYSKLPTLDMLGLTDAQVAHDGDLFEAQRNHTRIANIDILVDRGVNLMLGQPWLRRPHPKRFYPLGSLRGFNVFRKLSRSQLPPKTRIVEIPLPPGPQGERVLVALYLKPHPDTEELIRQGRWRAYPLL